MKNLTLKLRGPPPMPSVAEDEETPAGPIDAEMKQEEPQGLTPSLPLIEVKEEVEVDAWGYKVKEEKTPLEELKAEEKEEVKSELSEADYSYDGSEKSGSEDESIGDMTDQELAEIELRDAEARAQMETEEDEAMPSWMPPPPPPPVMTPEQVKARKERLTTLTAQAKKLTIEHRRGLTVGDRREVSAGLGAAIRGIADRDTGSHVKRDAKRAWPDRVSTMQAHVDRHVVMASLSIPSVKMDMVARKPSLKKIDTEWCECLGIMIEYLGPNQDYQAHHDLDVIERTFAGTMSMCFGSDNFGEKSIGAQSLTAIRQLSEDRDGKVIFFGDVKETDEEIEWVRAKRERGRVVTSGRARLAPNDEPDMQIIPLGIDFDLCDWRDSSGQIKPERWRDVHRCYSDYITMLGAQLYRDKTYNKDRADLDYERAVEVMGSQRIRRKALSEPREMTFKEKLELSRKSWKRPDKLSMYVQFTCTCCSLVIPGQIDPEVFRCLVEAEVTPWELFQCCHEGGTPLPSSGSGLHFIQDPFHLAAASTCSKLNCNVGRAKEGHGGRMVCSSPLPVVDPYVYQMGESKVPILLDYWFTEERIQAPVTEFMQSGVSEDPTLMNLNILGQLRGTPQLGSNILLELPEGESRVVPEKIVSVLEVGLILWNSIKGLCKKDKQRKQYEDKFTQFVPYYKMPSFEEWYACSFGTLPVPWCVFPHRLYKVDENAVVCGACKQLKILSFVDARRLGYLGLGANEDDYNRTFLWDDNGNDKQSILRNYRGQYLMPSNEYAWWPVVRLVIGQQKYLIGPEGRLFSAEFTQAVRGQATNAELQVKFPEQFTIWCHQHQEFVRQNGGPPRNNKQYRVPRRNEPEYNWEVDEFKKLCGGGDIVVCAWQLMGNDEVQYNLVDLGKVIGWRLRSDDAVSEDWHFVEDGDAGYSSMGEASNYVDD